MVLDEYMAIGESKTEAKADGTAKYKIFSWETRHTYEKQLRYFADWCQKKYHCTTLEECRPHINKYLLMKQKTCTAYTVKTQAAAIAKLYGCSIADFCDLEVRHRADITRSRGEKATDVHFSEKKHADFVEFCRGTGGRRSELAHLTGDKLIWKDGKPYILFDTATKGGRVRESPIIGEVDKIVSMMERAGSGKVFDKIPKYADVHGYRAQYATAIYQMYARPFEVCKKTPFYNPEHYNGRGKPKGGYDRDSVYYLRADRKGEWLDKEAMLKASEALGHSRISVVAQAYIRFN
jgi:integrase